MLRSNRIHNSLSQAFMPLELRVEDESHTHQVPVGAESHFKVLIVSNQFNTLTRIARHRAVNSVLNSEFQSGLHALSLFLYTPDEWIGQTLPHSPACKHQRHPPVASTKDQI